jgi:hypothetical protein
MQNIGEYYLIIDKIIDLPSQKRNFIMDMYRDMVHRIGDPSCKFMVNSYFNTLEMGGYISNRTVVERDKKLGDIVNE